MNETQLLRKILARVVAQPQDHGRWLNTFSFLEHVGSRKIMKSQNSKALSLQILTHLSEEIRHSLMLKKMCLRLNPQLTDYSDDFLIAGRVAEGYFQDLDCAVEQDLAKDFSGAQLSYASYLYVTWAVETRALEFYEIYESFLSQVQPNLSLKGLLKEEHGHLAKMNTELARFDLQSEQRKVVFASLERELFVRYLQAAAQDLDLKLELESAPAPSLTLG